MSIGGRGEEGGGEGGGGRGGGGWLKGKKQSIMTKHSVCRTQYLINHTSYDCDYWYTHVK